MTSALEAERVRQHDRVHDPVLYVVARADGVAERGRDAGARWNPCPDRTARPRAPARPARPHRPPAPDSPVRAARRRTACISSASASGSPASDVSPLHRHWQRCSARPWPSARGADRTKSRMDEDRLRACLGVEQRPAHASLTDRERRYPPSPSPSLASSG